MGITRLQDFQLFSAQFGSTLDMPPPVVAPTVRPLPQSHIVDLTGLEDPEPQAPQPGLKLLPVLTEGTRSPRGAGNAPEGALLVLNGFLIGLNTVDDKRVGSVARAFHLSMQLAGCEIPSFPLDCLRYRWERLRASCPLVPAVTHAIAEFVTAHPQDDPSTLATGQPPAV